jgi:UPF0755 protein
MRPNQSVSMIIVLDKSTTAYQFVHLLQEKKLIKYPRLMLALIQYQKKAHRLKAGVYRVNSGDNYLCLLNKVVLGDTVKLNFKIIEGTTQKKVAQDLSQALYLHYDAKDWLGITQNHPNAEGLLLADTYQYQGGSDATELLTQANKTLTNYLNNTWSKRAANLPYTSPYDLLIAASIIEKETSVPEERKLISGVVINRLKKGMPLQMDPTVIYGLADHYTGTLVHEDLSIDSLYNTYKNRGLPPTPIAMVGKEALHAAAHPELSNYLYYVARGDGTHQFSPTYEEQKRAINQYRRKKGT